MGSPRRFHEIQSPPGLCSAQHVQFAYPSACPASGQRFARPSDPFDPRVNIARELMDDPPCEKLRADRRRDRDRSCTIADIGCENERKARADRNRGTDDDSGKREPSRGKPGDKWRTRGSRSRLTCAGQLDRVPFSVAESGRSRSERIDSSMAAVRVHDRDPMGNRKWPRGVRGCSCVRLAYVKFTSGLPRNYHCGNSGEPGGWRWGKGRWERWQRERKRKD